MSAKKVFEELRVFAVMLLIVSSMRSALADWNDVPTGSMKPTIEVGDRVVVNKLAYDLKVPFTTIELLKWDDPRRGDIVVLFSPQDGTRLVKRVIAVPGDVVSLRDNQLFVNDRAAKWSPMIVSEDADQGLTLITNETLFGRTHEMMLSPHVASPVRNFGPIHVPAGQYFVLGDNRDNSNDSRFIGFISRQNIVGRATAVAFSLDREHHFAPRLDRFFKKLE
ncbi:MAG TPA: signal peptidase I [Thermoanaerobaculia bacterium]|nr:signal peptidase I [Thermoanaerobaculia bacterium]